MPDLGPIPKLEENSSNWADDQKYQDVDNKELISIYLL